MSIRELAEYGTADYVVGVDFAILNSKDFERPIEVYAIVNRVTKVREAETSYLHQAVAGAAQMQRALDQARSDRIDGATKIEDGPDDIFH